MKPAELKAIIEEAGFAWAPLGFRDRMCFTKLIDLVSAKAAAYEREACANHIEDCEPPVAVHGNRVEIGIVTRVAYANSLRARSPQ